MTEIVVKIGTWFLDAYFPETGLLILKGISANDVGQQGFVLS